MQQQQQQQQQRQCNILLYIDPQVDTKPSLQLAEDPSLSVVRQRARCCC